MFAVLFAGVTALLPAVATDILHVDPFGYGMLRAAQSVGAVAMAVVGGRLPPWKRPGRVLLIVVALFGARDDRLRSLDLVPAVGRAARSCAARSTTSAS